MFAVCSIPHFALEPRAELTHFAPPDVFRPLFEVTHNPSSHPELHVFLQRVIGFDTVDDESKTERRFYRKFPYPKLWNTKESPPYSYWYALCPSIVDRTFIEVSCQQGVLHVCEHGQSE